MKETQYQLKLVRKLYEMFPGCVVIRNYSSFRQGIPDILVLFEDKWAMLELKKDEKAHVQPNQRYYVNAFNDMSFASFINPENEEEVLGELQHAFGIAG